MPSSTLKARHPRSRAERTLLQSLDETIGNALRICNSGAGDDAIAMEVARAAKVARAGKADALEKAVTSAGVARLSSNGPPQPSLYYAMPAIPPPAPPNEVPAGMPPASVAPSGLSAADDEVLRHYGVHQLSEYARSTMLGELSDYLPSHRGDNGARTRFDALLTRVQQYQLACTVQNHLHARRSDALWNRTENRFHMQPVTRVTRRPIDIDEWAHFIQRGGDPVEAGLDFELLPSIRMERAKVGA